MKRPRRRIWKEIGDDPAMNPRWTRGKSHDVEDVVVVQYTSGKREEYLTPRHSWYGPPHHIGMFASIGRRWDGEAEQDRPRDSIGIAYFDRDALIEVNHRVNPDGRRVHADTCGHAKIAGRGILVGVEFQSSDRSKHRLWIVGVSPHDLEPPETDQQPEYRIGYRTAHQTDVRWGQSGFERRADWRRSVDLPIDTDERERVDVRLQPNLEHVESLERTQHEFKLEARVIVRFSRLRADRRSIRQWRDLNRYVRNGIPELILRVETDQERRSLQST
ncbi:MAG TPA: hypothetical protein VGA37_12945 [Gemmatimonadales bacterium]